MELLVLVFDWFRDAVFYWLGRRRRPLEFGECFLRAKGAYDVTGIELDGRTDPVKAYAFPTLNNLRSRPHDRQSPVYHFTVSNPGPIEAHITRVLVRVEEYRADRFYLGRGEMVAGGSNEHYDCEVAETASEYPANRTGPKADFLRIAPGGSEAIEVWVTSQVQGVYRLVPVVRYRIGRRSYEKEIDVASDYRVIFFSKAPPSQSLVAGHSVPPT